MSDHVQRARETIIRRALVFYASYCHNRAEAIAQGERDPRTGEPYPVCYVGEAMAEGNSAYALSLAVNFKEAETLLKGAMDAQDDRERQAGEKCGVDYAQWGCDWPDAAADTILSLKRQLQAATLVWSIEKPTVAGWYWWNGRCHDEDSPQIVEIFTMETQAGSTLGISFNSDYYIRLDAVTGEWAGPIPFPREAQL